MKSLSIALIVVLSSAVARQATAQNLAANQLNNIYLQNSAAGFSSDRIRNNVINRALPQYGLGVNPNRNVLSNALSTRSPQAKQKPFSNLQRGTNVTPYIGLLSENPFNSSVTNYYALVRPQIEQQRANEQLMKQNIAIQRRLNDIAVQAPYSPTGSEMVAPTGHVAVYQNMGGYYPQPAPPRR